jgi:hypothetical protein
MKTRKKKRTRKRTRKRKKRKMTTMTTMISEFVYYLEINVTQSSHNLRNKLSYIYFIPSFLPVCELARPMKAIAKTTIIVSMPLIVGIIPLLTRAFQMDCTAFGIKNNPISLYLWKVSIATHEHPKS